MTSAINTGTIDISFPIAGVNNSSQGFRDNFSGIKNGLELAKSEITDLQNNVILKSPLGSSILDNDMGNAIIKNAQTLGFRSSTYSLGNNLSGTVNVDLTLGDVHYGTMTGDTTITFTKWAPTGTQSTVNVILEVSAGLTLNLPTSVSLGLETIEGINGNIITVPQGVTRLHFQFNSLDCGTTIEVMPVDRPRQATQLQSSIVPASANDVGTTGQIAYDSNFIYVCVATDTWKRTALTTW